MPVGASLGRLALLRRHYQPLLQASAMLPLVGLSILESIDAVIDPIDPLPPMQGQRQAGRAASASLGALPPRSRPLAAPCHHAPTATEMDMHLSSKCHKRKKLY